MSAAASLPGESHLWKAAASDGLYPGSPPRGAASRRGSLRAPQEAHAHVARIIHVLGAEASLPLRHGRRAEAETELVFGVGGSSGPRATLAKAMAWPGNGRHPVAAIGSRRACELRRHVKIGRAHV